MLELKIIVTSVICSLFLSSDKELLYVGLFVGLSVCLSVGP